MNRSILSLLLAALATTVAAQTIKKRMAENVDITQYETFTIIQGESVTQKDQKRTSDKVLFETIRSGVRRELEDRGYKYLDDSTAQMSVSYVAGAFDFTDAGNVGPLGQAPASDPSELNQSRSFSKTTREGLLVLDIVETATKKELWKAETDDVPLERADLSRVIDATIYKAFKKFPDRKGGKKKKRK